MGSWGTGVFDDDAAADWAAGLGAAHAWQRPWRLRAALAHAVVTPGYLQRDIGAMALAAAAVVAASCRGGPALDGAYGPDPEILARLRVRRLDRALAVRAVRRVLGEASEWRELWEEAGEYATAETGLRPILEALARR